MVENICNCNCHSLYRSLNCCVDKSCGSSGFKDEPNEAKPLPIDIPMDEICYFLHYFVLPSSETFIKFFCILSLTITFITSYF